MPYLADVSVSESDPTSRIIYKYLSEPNPANPAYHDTQVGYPTSSDQSASGLD